VLLAAALATLVIGHSAQGREIRATRVGEEGAAVNVLVVGDVHGNEPAGEAIVAALRKEPVDGVTFWLVRTANPDGRAAGTRRNARGVDLNRNFPWRWRGGARGTYFPGPKAGSEPETQALMRLVRRVRPQLAIYYHQHMGITVRARGADPAVQREYARRTGLPLRSLPDYRGTAIGWENHLIRDGSAFVVELKAGPARPAPVRKHVDAVLALARRYR
jgi:protein MpaA